MAWTDGADQTTGTVITATIWNNYLGTAGSIQKTAPAVVTTAGDIVYATGDNAIARLAVGSANTVLRSTGSAPAWGTVAATEITANNWKVYYSNGSGATIELAVGAAGTVLTGNGTSAAPTFAAAAAGGKKTMTATGAISGAGVAVALNSDGTVSTIADTRADGSRPATGDQFEAAGVKWVRCGYDPDTGNVWVVYTDTGAGGYPTVAMGSVSGSTITWGTPVVTESTAVSFLDAVYDETLNQLWVIYSMTGSTYDHKIASCTFSGTTVTVNGTAISIRTGTNPTGSCGNSVLYNATDGVTIACIDDTNNSNRTDFYKMSISGSTITATASSDSTTAGGRTALTYGNYTWDSRSNRIVKVGFKNKALIAESYSYTNATPTVALTSHAQIINPSTPCNSSNHSFNMDYDDVNDFHHVGFKSDLLDNEPTLIPLRVGTAEIIAGRPYSLSGLTGVTASYPPIINVAVDQTSGNLYATYSGTDDDVHGVPLGIGQNMEYVQAGLDVIYNYTMGTGANGTNQGCGPYTGGKMIVCFNNDNGNVGVGNIYTMPTGQTTAPNFFGISEAAISGGADGDITIISGTNTDVSGLTRGGDVYITAAGAYSMTDLGYGKIGTATTATEIILTDTGNQAASGA